ncbi:Sugar phosphate isomerase/epimerase [Caldanaerobius fijiensis DSM 17918]|uniref:Sugar phosphate isomerase/epimerase n=1 Tax=Caldanaerobius fijiensis DSM 17918 TaxID=1121256 RepID=A0A1M4X8B2_9THEO|nr:sugar phosphate isomerase/epimerase family protein [Caldanaerobius fijiensis]SHE89714.1 Sugar phosphate isomerase/epimerase [Caldanaerobius fijiensis DSM 17918]
MKVSFTTLSCPDWPWEKILDEAARLGYDGIEIRGIEGEMYLPKAKPFLPENIDKTKMLLKQKNLKICCLDTSCSFHDKATYNNYLQEGIDTIDLAFKMEVPFIRVFGNSIPNLEEEEDVINMISNAMNELGHYAESKGVCVLIETHGDFANTIRLLKVLEKVDSNSVGVLWDINHPYKAFSEPVEETYARLKNYIKHTHIKDSIGVGKEAKLCMIGQGDMPIAQCIEILKQNGYNGWLSLEWEKKWHPELEEPEIALEVYIRYIKNLMK